MIIKSFKRLDHGDKVKDVIEVIDRKGKLVREFVWRSKNTELSEACSFWRLRNLVMVGLGMSDSDEMKKQDERMIDELKLPRRYNTTWR